MLDRNRLEAVVRACGDRLDGDWLLMGGALVALWLEPRRVTEDVDLIGLGGTGRERLQLMQLAEDLGLPIEAVNSAADYFVRRIQGWEDELAVFYRGARSIVYRPTPTLFVLVKCGRLSERDLEDCLAAIGLAQRESLPLDRDRIRVHLDNLPAAEEEGVAERRRKLAAVLTAPPVGAKPA
jgi:hypothetical protein